MPTREEKLAFIQSKMASEAGTGSAPSRADKIAFIQSQMNSKKDSVSEANANSPGGMTSIATGSVSRGLKEMVGRGVLDAVEAVAPYLSTKKPIEAFFPSTAEKHVVDNTNLPGMTPLQRRMNGIPDTMEYSNSDVIAGPLDIVTAEMGLPIVAKAMGSLGNAASKGLKGYAEKTMAKVVGAGAKVMENPTRAKAIGRNALDNKLSGPFVSAEETAMRAKAAKEKSWDAMKNIHQKVDESIGPSVSPLDTAVRVEEELAPVYRTPINKSEVGQMENTMESILARGDKKITIEETHALKREIDQVAYPKGRKPIDPTPKQQMAMDASEILTDEINKAAARGAKEIGDPELVKKLAQNRKAYGLNKETEKLATKVAGKEGADIGKKVDWTIDPIKFSSSVIKKFGPNARAGRAISADYVSKLLKQSPELMELSGSNPTLFQSIVRAVESGGPGSSRASHFPRAAESQESAEAPKKGPDKWAADGFQKLVNESPDIAGLKDILMKDARARELLVTASEAPKKEREKIIAQIKTKFGRRDR